MYEHFLIDNPPIADEGYEKEEAKATTDSPSEDSKSSRLPIQDHERYDDPEFDAEWNAGDVVSNSNPLGENPPEQGFEPFEEQTQTDNVPNTNFNNVNDWEEV